MLVKETLKIELDNIIKDLIGKIDIKKSETELSINEILDRAEQNGSFSEKEYIYSEDDDTLTELLAFSLGLSKLWESHKKENPQAPYTDLNPIIITYMRHMWGLELVPTIVSGRKE